MIIAAFILLSSCSLISQKKKISQNSYDYHQYTHEIGLNVTHVLGNIFSLNPEKDPYPYLLTYRKHLNDKIAFRSGFNFNINQDINSAFDNNVFLERKLNILRTDLRLGFEKKMILSSRFLFSYGVDVLGRYISEKSEVRDFGFNTFISDEKTFGGGLGPVMRFEFKISERMFLSIESSFYGFYSRKTEAIDINGNIDEEPSKSKFNLELALPQSLFFNVAF